MDDTELKQALVMRGLSVIGARQTLVNRYLKSDPRMYKHIMYCKCVTRVLLIVLLNSQ